MKIATWNVNSIRARADRIEDWLDKTEVDVLALQETKATDETFPYEIFEYSGYEVAHFGISQWNGVAIASRVGLEDIERTFPSRPPLASPAKNPFKRPEPLAPRATECVCGASMCPTAAALKTLI